MLEECLEPDIFSWIATPVDDAATVNLNGIKNAFSYYFKYISYSSPRILPRNFLGCPILCNWAFDNLILAEDLFPKGLWS